MIFDPEKIARERGATTSTENPPLDRRELVKSIAKAAVLPAVVAAFVASDVTEAKAS